MAHADDIERRIYEASQAAARERQAKEFLESLTKNDDLVKPIYNPEAYVFREKAIGAAGRGEIPRTKCTHPLDQIRQYVDEDPTVGRQGRPVNLFECSVCHVPIWFVDPWGTPLADG